MRINLRLLHEVFQPLLLQHGLFHLLLTPLGFLIVLLSLSLAVSQLPVPLPPEGAHVSRELPCSDNRLLCKTLGLDSSFPYFSHAILRELFIRILLISFKLLVDAVSLGNVPLCNVDPRFSERGVFESHFGILRHDRLQLFPCL